MNERIIKIINQIKELLKDNHGECDIPDHILVELARCLLPDIIAFCESEEGKTEFEKWKTKRLGIINENTNKIVSKQQQQ